MKKTKDYLKQKKANREKISVLTCYDYPTALWEDAAGVDAVLVGDSVGTNVLGYSNPREVTIEDMTHHTKAVHRGIENAYLVVDLPYHSYETLADALGNSRKLISCGADAVKLEGPNPVTIKHLRDNGIDVWGHLGYNPQIHDKARVQAKTAEAAVTLLHNALALEKAGACAIVLEMIPEEVAKVVSEKLGIPTIGIGAGRYTDGQVLVIHDLLGMNTFNLKHARRYEDIRSRVLDAFHGYIEDVSSARFPSEENARHLQEDELTELTRIIRD